MSDKKELLVKLKGLESSLKKSNAVVKRMVNFFIKND